MSTLPPVGGTLARLRRLRSLTLALLACVAAVLGAATPAFASHLQGGFFTANVTDTGRLQGTITYLEINPCPSGVGSQTSIAISVTAPGGQVVSKSVPAVATRCAGGATYTGSFDYPLDTSTFSNGAPDGNYTLTWTNCCRISGIANLANSGSASVTFSARVRKETGVATAAPFLGSDVATGIGIGQLYSQNLNASDADDVLGNGTLTYAPLTGAADVGPDSNIFDVSKLQANGQIEIPVGTTSGMANGSRYVYKVRVTDDQGDYAERDVLLKAVTPNRPPVINGLDTTNGYDINAGDTQTITFNATDPDGANTVNISGAGLPSWATLTQTPGNPAQATLTLAPPAGANTRVYRLNFDAADDDASQVLTGSRTIEVRVAGTPETQLLTKPAALTTATTATFTFAAADPAYTFECSIDGGTTWATCVSGQQYTGLTDGTHTFKVRANDGTQVDPSPASYTWKIDTTPPTTTFATKPAAATSSTSANFAFATNETGAVTYECSLDGATFTACTTPKAYTGLADGSHTLRVRATDAVGNVESPVAAYTWVIDRTAPDTTIASSPRALSHEASPAFAFGSDETGVTYECNLDGAGFVACPSPVTFSALADGSHTLLVRAIDGAGNTDATPASFAWSIDTLAPPAPAFKQVPSSPATSTSFVVDTTPGTTLECQLDDGAWLPCKSSFDADLTTDGEHTVKVRQLDDAGNASDVLTHTWILDRTAPDAPSVISGPGATTIDRAATFEVTAEPGATIECRLDGGAWTVCASPVKFTDLGLGDHVLELRATDGAGNVSAVRTQRWTITKAAEAPAGPKTVKVEISRSVAVDPKKSTVGCSLSGVNISACKVAIYATRAELGLSPAGTKSGDKLVRIGTGYAESDGSTGRVGVKVVLNGTGKRAMARPGGVKVRVNIKARPSTGGASLYAHKYSHLRPASQLVVPSDGLFATNSAVISRTGKRYLQSVAGSLYGAKSLTCVGHTDAQGPATYNAQLGLARAQAVCAYLGRLGVKVRKTTQSAGETRPRATNLSAAGRALNRRVELTVRYQ